MGTSIYDESFLDEEQLRKVNEFKAAWEEAAKRGDREGMDAAHGAAERVRAEANYSGGSDGGDYIDLGKKAASGAGVTPAALPSYRAQEDRVNDVYDAAREAELAALKGSYDAGKAALESEMEAIPGIYQQQRNAAASEAEIAGRNFNEYAAASGLNSGTAGQAQLAMSNQLQGELSDLGAQEAEANRKLEDSLAQLRIKYQNDIAAAVANGEYRRASALLDEYQRAEQSRVSTAANQADENYRAYESALSERQSSEKAARERAERLAEFGDFSGYRDLGYSPEEISAMTRAWIARHPELAELMGL